MINSKYPESCPLLHLFFTVHVHRGVLFCISYISTCQRENASHTWYLFAYNKCKMSLVSLLCFLFHWKLYTHTLRKQWFFISNTTFHASFQPFSDCAKMIFFPFSLKKPLNICYSPESLSQSQNLWRSDLIKENHQSVIFRTTQPANDVNFWFSTTSAHYLLLSSSGNFSSYAVHHVSFLHLSAAGDACNLPLGLRLNPSKPIPYLLLYGYFKERCLLFKPKSHQEWEPSRKFTKWATLFQAELFIAAVGATSRMAPNWEAWWTVEWAAQLIDKLIDLCLGSHSSSQV